MKIVIAGNYGAKNLGDEMILEGILKSLRSIIPDSEITVLSADPTETYRKYKVRSFPKFPAGIRSLFRYLKCPNNPTKRALQECDYFILGGGGLFGSLSFHANIIWLIQAYMAYRYGKLIIMYGQSISSIKWPLIRGLVKKIFQKSKFIAVRDVESRFELKKCGIENEIHVMPDLAFITECRGDKAAIVIKKQNLPPCAVLSLRKTSSVTKNLQNTIITFLNWLIDIQNYNLKFIDFQAGKKGDQDFHKLIISRLKNQSKIEHIQNPDSPNVLEIIAQADLVFGMRLHSIISAVKTCTPFIALNYSPKVEALVKSIPLTEYLVKFEELDFVKAKSLLSGIQKNKQQIRGILNEFCKIAYKKSFETEQLLKNFLIRNKP